MQQLKRLFEGRLERTYYFLGFILLGLIWLVISAFLEQIIGHLLASYLSMLLALLFMTSLNVRRLHDLNLDGRLYFFIFIIGLINNIVTNLISILIILILLFKIGTKGPNKYGAETTKDTKFIDAIQNRQKVQDN